MTPIKKVALILAGLAVVAFVGHGIYRSLLSDETRVRQLVTGAIDDFNDGSVRSVADALAETFRDVTRKLDRREVLQILQYVVLKARDAKTRRFALRAELVDDAIDVEIGSEGDTARARFEVRLRRFAGGEWSEINVCAIEAEVGKIDGDWQLVQTKHRWSRGRFRWRW
jgi:hypothetical protein